MQTFIPFDLERWQGVWENAVTHNAAESGVHPLSAGELLEITGTDPAELHDVRLGYSPTSGSDALREAVSQLYPGATRDNVLITVGSAEANFNIAWALSGPGTQIAVQTPVYKQIWGVAKNLGADVREFQLDGARGWALDQDSAADAIGSDTACVAVNNPSNPTGHVYSADERDCIVRLCEQAGAWLVVDEVYRGAERMGPETETWFGLTDRTVVTGGLSKAYGLPGLRIGWVVAPTEFINDVVQRHDYTVIGPAGMSDFLAVRALASRDRILSRTRRILEENYAILEQWGQTIDSVLTWAPPAAGAIVFARYHLDTPSDDLAEFFRQDMDTLLVPGSQFDRPGHVRIGFGEEPDVLRATLGAIANGFQKLVAD